MIFKGDIIATFLNKVLLAIIYANSIKLLTQIVVDSIEFDILEYDGFCLKSYLHISYDTSKRVFSLFLPKIFNSKKDFQSG